MPLSQLVPSYELPSAATSEEHMTTTLATTTLTLPGLIGVRLEDSPVLLNGEQIVRVAALLMQHRPQGPRNYCFVGGALGRAIGSNLPAQVIPLQRLFGNDPFLVMVGSHAALALLCMPDQASRSYRTRIYSEIDIADRAALALAHFSDAPDLLDVRCDQNQQRTFIGSILSALIADPQLSALDLAELVPSERRRITQLREQPANTPPAPSQSVPPPPATRPAPAPVVPGRVLTDRRAPMTGLIRHLREHVILVDQEGRVAGFSPSASELLGLNDHLIGQPFVEGPFAVFAPILTDALIGELSGSRSVRLANGTQVNVAISSIDHGTWALFIEPTEASHASVPAPTAGPATAALHEQTETNRSDRFMESFANGLRSPLRSLRDLIAQLPAAGQLNEQQSRLVGQIVKLNGEIMLLVNDLFVLGQMRMHIPEGRMPLRVDLLIEAAVGTQYAEFGRRGQTVELNIAPNLPMVPGSEEGLWRALAGLIDNAIKYSPQGARIVVSALQANQMVEISVADSGPGLEADELDQVFDPFYRAPSTAALGIPGRGLGLTIARAVVDQHGGRLVAASERGKGSCFTMQLPIE
jgi:nitrogen-specific signal transduction histidine kinase